MVKDAVLGPMAERVKTDMRLPYALSVRVKELADLVGVPMNAFYAMAAAKMCAELSDFVQSGKKRTQLLRELDNLFQRIISEAEKAA